MHALHPCFLQDLCIWNLVLPLDFETAFSNSLSGNVKSLCMTLVYCPGLTCIQEGWQYHSLVDFQLVVKLDSISLPDICTESSECHTGFCNSGRDLIINVYCCGESASQVGEFIKHLSVFVHSQWWLVHCTVFQMLIGVQPLSFYAYCEIINIT